MNPDQIALRKTLLTATDATAICGVNPWRTAHDVYADKVGDGPRFEGNERTTAGQLLEPIILALGDMHRNIRSVPNFATTVDAILPWLGATPDGFEVLGGGVGEPRAERISTIECKAVGYERWKDWGDDIPGYVLVQVTVQMHVTGLKKARVLALGGTELKLYTIELNQAVDDMIIEQLDNFQRHHLEPRIPPPVDGSAHADRMLKSLFPSARKRTLLAMQGEPLDRLGLELMAIKSQLEPLEKEKKRIEQELKLCMGNTESEHIKAPEWEATWSAIEPAEVASYRREPYRRFQFRAKP